jgi:hypothetical protein
MNFISRLFRKTAELAHGSHASEDETTFSFRGTGVRVRADGTEFWYRDGKLHSDDGPAVVYAGGNATAPCIATMGPRSRRRTAPRPGIAMAAAIATTAPPSNRLTEQKCGIATASSTMTTAQQ